MHSSLIALLYVVYDTSVWTEFGYTVQRYIGNATVTGLKIYTPIFAIGLVVFIIMRLTGIDK